MTGNVTQPANSHPDQEQPTHYQVIVDGREVYTGFNKKTAQALRDEAEVSPDHRRVTYRSDKDIDALVTRPSLILPTKQRSENKPEGTPGWIRERP